MHVKAPGPHRWRGLRRFVSGRVFRGTMFVVCLIPQHLDVRRRRPRRTLPDRGRGQMFELALLASSFEGAASRGGHIALTHGPRLGAGPAATAAFATDSASMRSDLHFWCSRACAPHDRDKRQSGERGRAIRPARERRPRPRASHGLPGAQRGLVDAPILGWVRRLRDAEAPSVRTFRSGPFALSFEICGDSVVAGRRQYSTQVDELLSVYVLLIRTLENL